MAPNPNRRSKKTLDYLKQHGLANTFPLSPHFGTGQWRAKIKGEHVYFGKLSDPEAARELYRNELPYRQEGLPVPGGDAPSAHAVVDEWMDYQQKRLAVGDIDASELKEYNTAADFFKARTPETHKVSHLGPKFWSEHRIEILGSTQSPAAITRYITTTRMIFQWAYQSEAIKSKINFGPDFKDADDTTLGDILDRWSKYQTERRDREDIAPKTCDDYLRVVDMLADHFGRNIAVTSLTPPAWEGFREKLSKSTTSPTILTRNVTVSKMIFRWADESDLIKDRVKFGPAFKVAPKREARLKRLKSQKRTINAKDIRALIDAADQPMKSMLLLGVNTGMTQAEVSGLTWDDLDLDDALLDMVRHKTAVERTATLWPETVASLREVPRKSNTNRVFTTRHGNAYVRRDLNEDGEFRDRDNVSREFAKLVKRAGVKLPAGVGFGKLRHSFRTIGDNVRDANAIRRIMGHELGRDAVEATYTGGVELSRLKAVTDYVREWLFKEND